MAVSHATFLAAHEQLHTIDDAYRLARSYRHELSYDALQCILAQKHLALSKLSMRGHRDVAASYVQRFQAGETLVEIAASAHISPTQMARVVLEEHLGAKKGKEAGQLLKNTESIEDIRLRAQVAAAVEMDPYYGPYVDKVKRIVGVEFENMLQQKLASRNIPYLTEDELRVRGDAKTPDALLMVPILSCGRVVNWIDSKATFGDPASHAEYHANQYSGYLNRYDTGLVIYWFGYDASIDTDPRLLILPSFPDSECELMSLYNGP